MTRRSASIPTCPRYRQTPWASSSPSRRRKLRGLSLSLLSLPEYFMFNYCRAWFYCKACHENVKDENLIKKCKCKHCKYPVFTNILEGKKDLKMEFLTTLVLCPYNGAIKCKGTDNFPLIHPFFFFLTLLCTLTLPTSLRPDE